MFQVTVMFVATRLLHLLLRPLKQPRVVCDILASIIVGPSGLGRWETYSRVMFPKEAYNLSQTVAQLAAIYYLFETSVQMEPAMLLRSGKKCLLIAAAGMATPFLAVNAIVFPLAGYIDAGIAHGTFGVFVGVLVSMSSFPVVSQLLGELNLLNSDLGRLALSASFVNQTVSWFNVALFDIAWAAKSPPRLLKVVVTISSMFLLVAAAVFLLRPWARRIIRRTPKDGRVREGDVFIVLLGVLLMSFLSNVICGSPMQGALIMGLVMPDGPPLGATVVAKVETVVAEILMPVAYLNFSSVDLAAVVNWRSWGIMEGAMLVGYLCKFAGTAAAALYTGMPSRSAVVLGTMMNFKGLLDIILDQKSYTVMMTMTLLTSMVVVPLVEVLYRPMADDLGGGGGGATVQQIFSAAAELRVLACVQSEAPVPSILPFLEASHAAARPLCVYVLHLVELIGSYAPILVCHRRPTGGAASSSSSPHRVHPTLNAFLSYDELTGNRMAVQPYTTVSPFATMHQDICRFADDKSIVLILLPFRRHPAGAGGGEITREEKAVRTMIPEILRHAPCSVGILVHGEAASFLPVAAGEPPAIAYKVAVLFWGGPDDREALAYASRMESNPHVRLFVARFLLPSDGDSAAVATAGEAEEERRLDEQLLSEVRRRPRAEVAEIVVGDAVETNEAICLACDGKMLVVVGRRQGPSFLLSASEWSQFPELGVLGDMFASSEFRTAATVLVLQQHQRCSSLKVSTCTATISTTTTKEVWIHNKFLHGQEEKRENISY
ncbi:unnamed protein product [Spirodela intermedia]|uniref:Uncharacterized protein n=1 Tax=Spirodela intermedia TaxID=51605 RepID=A0A7I8IG79_SPIIN|nr:unnamed protein product [Spirodela intermedia]CAA6656641.1 unnamed protein product [Spirodela intermedia]